MKKNIFIIVGFLAFSFSSTNMLAQNDVPISDEGTNNSMQCSMPLTLTDSDANGGFYESNENYTITLCGIEGSEAEVQFLISPAIYGHTWDVDSNSELYVYDGANTGSPLIGVYNSVTDPDGVNVSASGTCLTITFISGAQSSGEGFTGIFQCAYPLQDFVLELVSFPEHTPWGGLDHNSIRFCFGDSVILNAITQYPLSTAGGNGYEQSDELSYFRWDMGDGTIYQGLGMNEISHNYANPFGYQVVLSVTDSEGQIESERIYVLYAPRPIFSNLAVNDTLCVGEQTTITGGILDGDTIGVTPNTSAILGGGILGDMIFLPDGTGDNYETIINISDFGPDQVIENADDIVSLCLNIEHSFLGDLEMMLTCPNGTSINIFNSYNGLNAGQLFPGGFGGGGTFLGHANDASSDPGLGLDYCFADNAAWGTLGEEFVNGNTVPVDAFTTGIAMAPGTYLPEESFSEFIGCPINGDWTLTVRDSWGSDDGWIFNWSIYFNPNINPNTIYYSPAIAETMWEDNVDIVSNDGTSIVVEPSQPGNNSFTFVVVDEFGCIHDTSVFVYVRPEVTVQNNIACDLTHTLTPQNAPAGAEWTMIDAPSENSTAEFEYLATGIAEVEVNEYGFYDFLITENNCGYEAVATIDFRPIPQIEPFVEDTVLCVGASINFDAGPQEDNSGNFNIVWTLNGNAFNTEDYDVTVDQTGQYILTIIDVCGAATDTSDVVAIQLTFEGDTVCGLNAFADVTLAPEGNGTWSSIASVMSFDMPNELSTGVNSSEYGVYPATFTDSRCPNDGVTHIFRFVEQPVIDILPQNPDFCVELDSLIISTNVSGSFNGNYFWDIIGPESPQIIHLDDSLFFGPETFVPLEVYQINVQIFDAFGVCNVATGTTSFETVWCTYDIPNVITPNGDGMNDLFVINGIEYFPETHLTIFNRWGNVVFDQANYDQYQLENQGWRPEDVSGGTYFYELRLPQVQKLETGNITILKDR